MQQWRERKQGKERMKRKKEGGVVVYTAIERGEERG